MDDRKTDNRKLLGAKSALSGIAVGLMLLVAVSDIRGNVPGLYIAATGDKDSIGVLSGTNVRSCPRLNCEVVAVSSGRRIVRSKLRPVKGEGIDGSDEWFEIRTASKSDGFIHSSRVSFSPPPWWRLAQIALLLPVAVMALVLVSASSIRFRDYMARREWAESLMLSLTVIGGVLCMGFAILFFNHRDSNGLAEFLYASYLNLGTGFLSGTVIAVMLQAMIVRRTNYTSDDLFQQLDGLQAKLDELLSATPVASGSTLGEMRIGGTSVLPVREAAALFLTSVAARLSTSGRPVETTLNGKEHSLVP